jgi:hypothetical protein
MKSTITIAATLAILASRRADAFQTRPSISRQRVGGGGAASTKLAVLGPEHVNDLQSLLSADSSHPAWTLLADAAQATLNAPTEGGMEILDTAIGNAVELTGEIAKDDSWWKSYLKIFEASLLFIHDTIDEPLKSVGIEQTWGISIALFTACKFYFLFENLSCLKYILFLTLRRIYNPYVYCKNE